MHNKVFAEVLFLFLLAGALTAAVFLTIDTAGARPQFTGAGIGATISKVQILGVNGNYIACQEVPNNGTNATGGLTGTFPQPNNSTCLPTGLSVLLGHINATGMNSSEVFVRLMNMTNNSNHMTVLVHAVIDLLNQTAVRNVTVTLSGPYTTAGINSTNFTSVTGNNVEIRIKTLGGSFPTSGGGGGSYFVASNGPTSGTGVGAEFSNGVGHFVIVLDPTTQEEPFLCGVWYGNIGHSEWCINIVYWDPLDNQYHSSRMSADREFINLGGRWAKVGDTVRID